MKKEMMKKEEIYDVAVIGGGAAGLMAALAAAAAGARAVILEKMKSPGQKILATGNGRCNFTIKGDVNDALAGFHQDQRRFLKGAFYQLPPDRVVEFFAERNVRAKIERGNRIFPADNTAASIRDALVNDCRKKQVTLQTKTRVKKITVGRRGGFQISTETGKLETRAIVLATGGKSLTRTGSSGDGYALVQKLGHTVNTLRPALVPLLTVEKWPGRVNGLALKNIQVMVVLKGKKLKFFGEMVFTENGIGGPIILELSRFLTDEYAAGKRNIPLGIDLKPALDAQKLDKRLQREFADAPRKTLRTILPKLMPNNLATIFYDEFGFIPTMAAGEMTRTERHRLRDMCKALPLTVSGLEPLERAIITRGGISRKEIKSSTMGSTIVPGLFFAGELIDIDGDCGGYNLQAAWSTGWLAGESAAKHATARVT